MHGDMHYLCTGLCDEGIRFV